MEDTGLRMELAQWAAQHIQSVQITAQTPVLQGIREGLQDWDKRMVEEKVLATLRTKLSMLESKTSDGKWLTQRIGVVIIKD